MSRLVLCSLPTLRLKLVPVDRPLSNYTDPPSCDMDIPTLRLPDGDDDMTVKVSLHHHEAATMSRHSTMANGDERTREDTVGEANGEQYSDLGIT